MIARDLITNSVPYLNCSDTGSKAINIMESYRISHLPIVSDKEYKGLISDKELYDLVLEDCCLADHQGLTLIRPFVWANQHIYEVIQMVQELSVSVIPVLEMNEEYCGLIVVSEMASKFTGLVGVTDPGAVIVLEMGANDYSLAQIAQIVESNDAKILSLYVNTPKHSSELNVNLKVNVTDVSSIVQTLVRYDYNIKAVYMDNSQLSDMYNERYEQFMRYLNI